MEPIDARTYAARSVEPNGEPIGEPNGSTIASGATSAAQSDEPSAAMSAGASATDARRIRLLFCPQQHQKSTRLPSHSALHLGTPFSVSFSPLTPVFFSGDRGTRSPENFLNFFSGRSSNFEHGAPRRA